MNITPTHMPSTPGHPFTDRQLAMLARAALRRAVELSEAPTSTAEDRELCEALILWGLLQPIGEGY
jgi:hypothetical protein